MLNRLTPLFCVLLLAGCAAGTSQSVQTRSQETHRPAPATSVPVRRYQPDGGNNPIGTDSAQPQPSANQAANALLAQAAEARSNGDLGRAQALAERAQSLAPRDAACYLELSRIYQQRGDEGRARQMALRGLSVSNEDPALRQQLELLGSP